MRFRQYGVRQRFLGGIELGILRQEFEGDGRGVVGAFGDASVVSKGRYSGPVKTIRRELAEEGQNWERIWLSLIHI